MLKAAVSFARAMKLKGIVNGDKVVLLMHNHHYLLPCWLGCVLAGVILCPFHFTNTSVKGLNSLIFETDSHKIWNIWFTAELCELIEQINPKMMVTSYLDAVDMFQSVFKQVGIDCPLYIYENQIPECHDLKPLLEEHTSGFDKYRPRHVSDPDRELLVIVLSSSTTGKPKLINSTHSQLLDLT